MPRIQKTAIIQTRVPERLRDQVEELALSEGMTVSEWLRTLIRAAVKKELAA